MRAPSTVSRSCAAGRTRRARVEAVGGEGLGEELQEAEGHLERAAERLRDVERRAAAARLLFETLEACRAEEEARYRLPLKERIEELGRIVFGRDFMVELDDELAVHGRTLDGISLELDALSTGAKEQMGLLVRLAAASLVAPEEGAPIILDDTLGHTDEDRLDLMAHVLNRIGRTCQVVVLTSAPRRYARLIDRDVVDLWDPAVRSGDQVG